MKLFKRLLLFLCLASLCNFILLKAQGLKMSDMQAAGEAYDEGEKYYTKGDYKKAAESFARSFEIFKTSVDAAFNAAVCFALINDTAQAFKYLRYAIDLGKHDFENDPDLINLKKYSTFNDLVYLARQRYESIQNQKPIPLIKRPATLEENTLVFIIFHDFNSSPKKTWEIFKEVLENKTLAFLPSGSKILGYDLFDWSQDEEEYERIAEEIDEFLLMQKITSKHKVILMGIGKGGFLANSFAILFPEKFHMVINWFGSFPNNLRLPGRDNHEQLTFISILGEKDSPEYNEKIENVLERIRINGLKTKVYKIPTGRYLPENKNELLRKILSDFNLKI